MTRLLALLFPLVLSSTGIFTACLGEEVPDTLDSVSYEQWYESTHPSVNLTLSKDKDVTNWDTNIALSRPFGRKFDVRLNASMQTRENTSLNRADANDGTSASLGYKLNDNLRFSVNYNSTVLANWYDLSGGSPDDRKKRGSFTIDSDISANPSSAVSLSAHLGGGTTQNSYSDISNSGNQADVSASVTYNPAGNLRASANYSGKRLLLSSQVDSSGVVVLETEDRTFSQNLTTDVAFDVFPGLRFMTTMLANDEQKQRPEQIAKEQETELRKRRGVTVNSNFNLMEWWRWDAALSLSRAKSRFLVRSDRNSDINIAEFGGNMRILPWAGATVSFTGKWGDTRSVYVTADTGNNIQKSLSLKYTQNLGPKADLAFSALSDLTVVAYDDKAANPKDRDMLSNRFRMDVNYKPRQPIKIGLAGEFSDERSVYTQGKQSANNKNTERYRLTGNYDLKTWRNISLNQQYDISAVFTDYHFDDTRNTLVRNSNITTGVNLDIGRGIGLNIRHSYKYQDQGSYSRRGGKRLYSTATEGESQHLNIGLSYRIGPFRFRFRHAYFVDTRWRYEEGLKLLDYNVRNTEISGRVGFNHNFGESSKLSFHIEHNRKEGDRVNEAFREYWNAEISATHIF